MKRKIIGFALGLFLACSQADAQLQRVWQGDLEVNGGLTVTGSTSFSNDVSVISSSTDNAIARFNSTAGLIQNSGVTIDDSNNLTLPGTALTLSAGGDNNGTTVIINSHTSAYAAPAAGNAARSKGEKLTMWNDGSSRLSFGADSTGKFLCSAGGLLNFYTSSTAGATPSIRLIIEATGDVVAYEDIEPDTDGTGNLGTIARTWADVNSLMINGADICLQNKWRLIEAEDYGYPGGICIDTGVEWRTPGILGGDEVGEGDRVFPEGSKPVFAITREFIEFNGVRITSEQWAKLAELLGG